MSPDVDRKEKRKPYDKKSAEWPKIVTAFATVLDVAGVKLR